MKKPIVIISCLMISMFVGCNANTGAEIKDDTIVAGEQNAEIVENSDSAEQAEEDSTDTSSEDGNYSDLVSAIEGMWQTASIGYEVDGDLQPSFYVQFEEAQINYGHMSGEEFVLDHSDKIVSSKMTSRGGYIVKAESDNGYQYTYQSAESDPDILEYYETWNEIEFSDKYIGGKSLCKVIAEQ